MQAPSVAVTTLVVVLIAALQALASELSGPAFYEPWIPFAVIGIGAVVKGLQLWLEMQAGEDEVVALAAERRKKRSFARRFLVG